MSDEKDDGGPAFPMQMPIDDVGNPTSASVMGMSLRAYFAAAAMQGLIASGKTLEPHSEGSDTSCPSVARRAIEYADALINELGE